MDRHKEGAPTWKCLDGFVGSRVGSQHVAQVLSCRGELSGFGRGEGAIDPATE